MRYCILLMIVLCSFSILFVSCSNDDGAIGPLTAESVKGVYDGTLVVGSGEAENVVLTVGDSIVIPDFAVDSIVRYAVPQEYFDEAVASLNAVELTIDYSVEIFGLNMFMELSPRPLSFVVEYGGVEHEVDAVLYADDTGVYNGSDYSLSFEVLLSSMTLDGTDVSVSKSLSYQFDLYKTESE